MRANVGRFESLLRAPLFRAEVQTPEGSGHHAAPRPPQSIRAVAAGGRALARRVARLAGAARVCPVPLAPAAIALMASLGCGCGGAARTDVPQPRLVQAIIASRDTLAVAVNAWGVAEANRRVELAFEVQGTVEALPFDEGDRVSKGSTLASLRQGRFLAGRAAAKASYEDAGRNLRRTTTLSQENVVSDDERERAEIALAAAEAALRDAEEDLRGSAITAPFDGVVTKRYCELGEVTSPGKPAFVFMETDPIVIAIDLSDADVSAVAPGQPAVARLDAYPGVTFEGRVSRVAAAADEQGGAFKVEIEIPNAGSLIKPGMAAEVQVTVNELTRSILIPTEAVIYEKGPPFAYVASGGKADRRQLTVEAQAGMTMAVEGLAEGDTVVTAGNRFLKDGEPVRVSLKGTEAPPRSAGEISVGRRSP